MIPRFEAVDVNRDYRGSGQSGHSVQATGRGGKSAEKRHEDTVFPRVLIGDNADTIPPAQSTHDLPQRQFALGNRKESRLATDTVDDFIEASIRLYFDDWMHPIIGQAEKLPEQFPVAEVRRQEQNAATQRQCLPHNIFIADLYPLFDQIGAAGETKKLHSQQAYGGKGLSGQLHSL